MQVEHHNRDDHREDGIGVTGDALRGTQVLVLSLPLLAPCPSSGLGVEHAPTPTIRAVAPDGTRLEPARVPPAPGGPGVTRVGERHRLRFPLLKYASLVRAFRCMAGSRGPRRRWRPAGR